MFYVMLKQPIAGVRSQLFVFYNQSEAEEFASCLHSAHPGCATEEGTVGEATEVFEHWSF
jgi:hypothetical protein